MPIEIRRSDILHGVAKTLGQASTLVGDIVETEFEKQRVKSVDAGLILSEKARQADLESYKDPKKVLKVYPADALPGEVSFGQAQYKALGDVEQEVVEEELRRQQEALERQLTLSTPNKRAREELIARSRMAAIDHRNKVMGEWRSAAQGVYLTGTSDYATLLTMDRTSPLESSTDPATGVKTFGLIEKMQDRIAEGIGAGWITRAEGEAYMVKFEDQLQYSRAINGALDLAAATTTKEMKPSGEYEYTSEKAAPPDGSKKRPPGRGEPAALMEEAPSELEMTSTEKMVEVERPITPEQAVANAGKYLESIPYYQNKPEEREKIFDAVLRKYTALVKENETRVDSKYALLHINANTVEKIDAALAELAVEKVYEGTRRYSWEQALRNKKDDLLREEAALLSAGGETAEASATEEGLDALRALFWSDATEDEYVKGISELYRNGDITDETGQEWLKKSRKEKKQNPYKVQGSNAIAESFKIALDRVKNGTSEKDKARWIDLMTKSVKYQEQFATEVAGKDDANEIMAIAKRYMMIDLPSQADFNIGDIDFAKKGDVAKLLTAMRDMTIPSLSPTDTGKMATVVTTMLKDAYGVKPEQFVGEPWESRMMGNAMVEVKGLEPGRPNESAYYYLGVDDAGKLVMNVAVITEDGTLKDIGPTYAPSLAKTRADALKAATLAATEKGLSGVDLVAEVQRSVGGEALSAEELAIVPFTGINVSASQAVQFEKWIYGKESVEDKELEAFSKASKIPMVKLKSMLANHWAGGQ